MIAPMILSASCGTEFKSEQRTLRITPHEFNHRFLSNINNLTNSLSMKGTVTTLEIFKKESKPSEDEITYKLSDDIFFTEISNGSNKELKKVYVNCFDLSEPSIRTTEVIYVAMVKAISPEFKDFKMLQDELRFESDNKSEKYKEVVLNKIFFSRYMNNAVLGTIFSSVKFSKLTTVFG